MMDWGQQIWTLATPWPKVTICVLQFLPQENPDLLAWCFFLPDALTCHRRQGLTCWSHSSLSFPKHTSCVELTSHLFGSLFSSQFLEHHLACGDMSLKGNWASNLLLSLSLSALSLSSSKLSTCPLHLLFLSETSGFLLFSVLLKWRILAL